MQLNSIQLIQDCQYGSYGENCANTCNCVNSLKCDSVSGCICMTGYIGEKCDIDIDECLSTKNFYF